MSKHTNHTVSEFPRLSEKEPPVSCLQAPPCPAAEIGKLFAKADELIAEYGDREHVGIGIEGRLNRSVWEHADDAAEAYVDVLSHIKARSVDGAAVQTAAALRVVRELAHAGVLAVEAGGHTDDEAAVAREKIDRHARAIERMLYSVLSVLMDRVEADFHEYGVEALAGELNNPWTSAESRLRSYKELQELRSAKD